MLPEIQRKKWAEFYDSARNNDELDPQTTLLIHLAAAMSLGCEP